MPSDWKQPPIAWNPPPTNPAAKPYTDSSLSIRSGVANHVIRSSIPLRVQQLPGREGGRIVGPGACIFKAEALLAVRGSCGEFRFRPTHALFDHLLVTTSRR